LGRLKIRRCPERGKRRGIEQIVTIGRERSQITIAAKKCFPRRHPGGIRVAARWHYCDSAATQDRQFVPILVLGCVVVMRRDKGNLATIGRARAVADIKGVQLSGMLAWMTWLAVHIFYLIGFQNRVLVVSRRWAPAGTAGRKTRAGHAAGLQDPVPPVSRTLSAVVRRWRISS
jgi:hypothetical protein